MDENRGYTYFRIAGSFDPDVISARLGLTPTKSWRIGDRRGDGSIFDFASWEYGRCGEYEFDVGNMMRKTVSDLLDKIDELNRIRETYDVAFSLEVVPTLYPGNDTPALAPPLDVIDFCHATRTPIDIDLYVYSKDDTGDDPGWENI